MMHTYEETQYFRKNGFIMIIYMVDLLFIGIVCKMFMDGVSKAEWIPMLFAVTLLAAATLIMTQLRLITNIDTNEIKVRFLPFPKQWKYSWTEVKSYSVKKYDPIKDYGGWGLRWAGKKRAFNVYGSEGLELIFNDDRTLMIGTNDSLRLKNFINSNVGLAKS